MTNESAELKAKYDAVKNKIAEKENALAQKQKEIEQYDGQIAGMEKQAKDLKAEIVKHQAEIEKLIQAKKNISVNDVLALRNTIGSYQTTIGKREQSINEILKSLPKKEEFNSMKGSIHSDLNHTYDYFEKKLSGLRNELDWHSKLLLGTLVISILSVLVGLI